MQTGIGRRTLSGPCTIPTAPFNIRALSEETFDVSNVPNDLRYTADHEYLKPSGDGVYIVGVTDYAQDQLGDVVYVELPKVGTSFGAHDVFGTIEAVKAVSELFCPIAGEVVEINERLDPEPALVNSDPYGDGWMIKLRASNAGDVEKLLDGAAYKAQIGE
jgi:glycine cleavage system H protein